MEPRQAGITLIEMILTLAAVGVTLALGFPSFSQALDSQRVNTSLNALSTDMAMARSTAVMRGTQIVICPKDAANHCVAGLDWSSGWMVFNDADGNRTPDADADIIRLTEAPGRAKLSLRSTRPNLRYQSDGRSANSNLSVHVCRDGLSAGKVVVNNLGRVRSERSTSSNVACPGT